MSIQKKTKKSFPKEKLLKLSAENVHTVASLSPKHVNKAKVLAKLSDQQQQQLHLDEQNSSSPKQQSQSLAKKINKKEETLKEIKKYCLSNIATDKPSDSMKANKNYECVKYLAKEFLSKCKTILDEKQFESLIVRLAATIDEDEDTSETINDLYKIVQKNKELKLNFCAFLSSETSTSYDLFMESLQYEKTNEFIQMLQTFIANKCSMKRLLQSIISTCSSNLPITNDNNALKQCQFYQQKQIINDIKAKVKSSTKNNPLVNYELDYLFDQEMTKIKPQYEKVSLVNNIETTITETAANQNISTACSNSGNYEYVDLSKDPSLNDNGTRKCACECHQQQASNNDENLLQTVFNHCILCSLKLIKGKLCIKCEGKKAIPLNYRLTNNSNCKTI